MSRSASRSRSRRSTCELRGHAIECRINAEDVAHGFLPSPGLVTAYREPSGPGVRVDSGVAAGSEISGVYDPMIAKLIVHGVDREHARRRMLRALDEFVIEGPKTLLGFHKALLEHECFVRGETCHGLVESEELAARAAELDGATAATACYERPHDVERCGASRSTAAASRCACSSRSSRGASSRAGGPSACAAAARGGGDAIVSPMQGTVLSVAVADGDDVEAGQVLCIVEAMKMENEVRAPHGGVVAQLSVAVGAGGRGQVICVLERVGSFTRG